MDTTSGGEWEISLALAAWLALRRVERGGVVFDDLTGWFFDGGRRVPAYLGAAFAELVDRGYLCPRPGGSVEATESGHARYTALCAARRQRLADPGRPARFTGRPPSTRE